MSTLPDLYSSRPMSKIGDENRAAFQEMARIALGHGATWFRFTVDEPHETLWCESWLVRPEIEAEFTPPYTAEPQSPVEGEK